LSKNPNLLKLIDAEQAFIVAVEFNTLASVDAQKPQYINADLVNKAFAVEVYLKCLHAIEHPANATDEWFKGKPVAKEDLENKGYALGGHFIKLLFDELSGESKTEITSAVNAAIEAGPSKGGFIVIENNVKLPQFPTADEVLSGICCDDEPEPVATPKFANIDEVLAVIDNVFVDMRYTFEITNKEPKSVVYLDELQEAIEARILTLKPVFQMYAGKYPFRSE